MRKSERYTVPYPPAEPAPEGTYRQRFQEFPLWYRWYLRVLALLHGASVEQTVRRHELQELRRNLTSLARDVLDPSVPALLPGFHLRLRSLEVKRRRLIPLLREVQGGNRGRFLAETLARQDQKTHQALEEASAIPETLLDSTETTLAVAREAVQNHLQEELEVRRHRIEETLSPLWSAITALSILVRVDLESLLPPAEQGMVRTPLRVVQTPLQELYQTMELLRRERSLTATEELCDFARRRARLPSPPPREIWQELEEFRGAVPLLEITKLAWEDPYLEIRPLLVRNEWWQVFHQTWIARATERTGALLLTHRTERVRERLSQVFLAGGSPPSWLPSELYPTTLGFVLLLGESEFFHDTRRVVTQVVIDAVFQHLDVRNALHQAALQIDQSLERLSSLMGKGEKRGALGEELLRIRRRSGTSSLARRQLSELYEQHRHRIRTALEGFMEALVTGSVLIDRTLSGATPAFDYQMVQAQSFSGDFPARELLQTVATHWAPLGRELRALYTLETTAGP
ncbi:hypothetical protein AU468_08120 [Alkalispirochaeta sphaeroplastigenens]|uniref:Uncharacterized protein n=1 Tax=Alkalispirochaeta sphaeroplastigenens TaxID=1187066 RepID=A0A2S4JPR0_9SPIO|nr:DUF5312 family protein [Alkalispirochaeta sphaeroplastigenens]POR01518.1 hypothetical protein AU468_08120 [Alkalispirochaeta sphaeroplastigenens]